MSALPASLTAALRPARADAAPSASHAMELAAILTGRLTGNRHGMDDGKAIAAEWRRVSCGISEITLTDPYDGQTYRVRVERVADAERREG